MRSRWISRLLASLAATGAVASCIAVGCEPQEIYLFDEASAGLEGDDAGTDPPAPPAPAPSQPDAQAPPAPPPQQPECQSSACEQCVARGDCSVAATTLLCHPVTGECELPCDPAASSEERLCAGTEQCDPVLGLCVECVEDTTCSYGARQMCDRERGQCVQCLGPGDCPSERPLCDPYARCVGCLGDGDCATNEVCLAGEQRCVQCRDDSDCRFSDDDVFCLAGQQRCVECLSDDDCVREDPRKPFCSTENDCEDERE